ncbi:hypothetical protein Ciccas_000291 [Cichlidogyrus casuarinus]|uniref:Uncharacterized protein n=1 Tax=Cichlidogyrus casuarinus TaxID=1844966 RepID=A0ABD2QNK8_9PLAT
MKSLQLYSRDEILSAITMPLPVIQESEERETSDESGKHSPAQLKSCSIEDLSFLNELGIQDLEDKDSLTKSENESLNSGQLKLLGSLERLQLLKRRVSEHTVPTASLTNRRQAFQHGRSQSLDETANRQYSNKFDKSMTDEQVKRFSADDYFPMLCLGPNSTKLTPPQNYRDSLSPITEIASRNSPENRMQADKLGSLHSLDGVKTAQNGSKENGAYSWKRRMSLDPLILNRIPGRDAKDRWLNRSGSYKVSSAVNSKTQQTVKSGNSVSQTSTLLFLRLHKEMQGMRSEIDTMAKCMQQMSVAMQQLVNEKTVVTKQNSYETNSVACKRALKSPGEGSHSETSRVVTFELPPKGPDNMLEASAKHKTSPLSFTRTMLKKKTPSISETGDQQPGTISNQMEPEASSPNATSTTSPPTIKKNSIIKKYT